MSLNEPWRPRAGRRKEQSETGSKILSPHRGVCRSDPRHQKHFSAVSLHRICATSPQAGLLCRLPRPCWGQELSQLPGQQEQWSAPCHLPLQCCQLTHCSIIARSSHLCLLPCSFQPSSVALFLLGFTWCPDLAQSGQFQLVPGPKDLFTFALFIWRGRGKEGQHCAPGYLRWAPGSCASESITGTMDVGIKHCLRSSVVTHCCESVLVTVAVVTCHYRLVQAKAPFCPTALQMLAAIPGPAGLACSILPGQHHPPCPCPLLCQAAGRQRAGKYSSSSGLAQYWGEALLSQQDEHF